MTPLVRRWWSAALVVVAAVGVAVSSIAGGNGVAGVAFAVVLLACAWLVSPWLAPRGPRWAAAQQLAQTRGVPLILWKPGCLYCIRLRLALGPAGSRAVWVDIWADEDAAAATREVNQGNETTPTVIAAGRADTNPAPSVVKDQLRTR